MGKGSGGGGMGSGDVDSLIKKQRQANAVGQETPWGSISYSPSGDTSYMKFSGPQQALLEQQQRGQMAAGRTAMAGLGDLADGRQAVEQATFDRAMGLMNPEFARIEGGLRNRLANQGLPQSSGAFNREMTRFDTDRGNQIENAALSAVMAGGNEQSRMTNQIMQLMGGSAPGSIPVMNMPQVTVPMMQQQQGGMSPGMGAMMGAGTGAATGAAFGPWGAGIGAGMGGLLGLFAGQR